MKVSLNCLTYGQNSQNFKGIKPPYEKDGYRIIPISQDPDTKEIEQVIRTANSRDQKPMEGFNGECYWLGRDLVVKRYKDSKHAFNYDPMRDINMLDKMYDYNITYPNSQQGRFAFVAPDGRYYLVSTRVKGATPDGQTNPFTKENLKSLLDIIYKMDTCGLIKGSSPCPGYYSDVTRFMNYDFNSHNVNITPTTAGVFDFEYSAIENLDKLIYGQHTAGHPHLSDTSKVTSSLRSFEFYTLCDYLLSCNNPDEIFEEYIKLKGDYHAKMSEYYEKIAGTCYFTEKLQKIAEKEAIHARLLSETDKDGNISPDIKAAEAIKIQMANFTYRSTPYCSTDKLNIRQAHRFHLMGDNYFKKMRREAYYRRDEDRVSYYQDCRDLFNLWFCINYLPSGYELNDNRSTKEYLKTLFDVLEFDSRFEQLCLDGYKAKEYFS